MAHFRHRCQPFLGPGGTLLNQVPITLSIDFKKVDGRKTKEIPGLMFSGDCTIIGLLAAPHPLCDIGGQNCTKTTWNIS